MEDGQIPIPEYCYLNKGETGAPHRLNASLIYELPFGGGKRWLNNDGVLSNVAGGLAAEHVLQLRRRARS